MKKKPTYMLGGEPRRKAIDSYLKQSVPISQRNKYKKAVAGSSRVAAMEVFCVECMGWVATEVKNCEAFTCPLWPYRAVFRRSLDQSPEE